MTKVLFERMDSDMNNSISEDELRVYLRSRKHQHVFTTCLCYMSLPHVFTTCLYYMSLLHVFTTCLSQSLKISQEELIVTSNTLATH
jgi:hypothetical protein